MKSIISIAIAALLSNCQVHRVTVVRVETDSGDPICGATVGMFSMQSGHPLYPDLITDAEGLAPIIPGLYVNKAFIFNVKRDSKKYVFDSKSRRYENDRIVVLRLKDEYKIEQE